MFSLARRIVQLAGVVLLGLSALPAQAITLNTGQSVLFAYDFTSATPPPPYTAGSASFTFANFQGGDLGSFSLFDNIDGTGLLFGPFNLGPTGILTIILTGAPGLLDGIFSIRIGAVAGPFDVIANPATVRIATGAGATITPTVVGSVPEPASLALLGLGLAGLGAMRRRKQQ